MGPNGITQASAVIKLHNDDVKRDYTSQLEAVMAELRQRVARQLAKLDALKKRASNVAASVTAAARRTVTLARGDIERLNSVATSAWSPADVRALFG